MVAVGKSGSFTFLAHLSEVRDDTIAVLSSSDLKTFPKMTVISLFSQF